jgi:Bcr/CflA subfamily drug resistance transporter
MSNLNKTTCIIVILCLISAIGRFAMDSYLPSLPAISTALGVSNVSVQLTLTFYVLGFGLSQLIYGPLSDRYGRKKILISGLIIFLLANVVCIFTTSLPELLIARLFAGIGLGVCGVLNRAIASDTFSGATFSRVWSYTTTTLVVVLILAPLVGSWVQLLFDWYANFLLTTLFVAIALIFIFWKLPETHLLDRLSSLSLKNIVSNYRTILLSRTFVVSTFYYTCAFAGLMVYFQLSPFILTDHFHLSVLQYGYASLVIAASYLAGGILVSRFVQKFGTRNLLLIGMSLMFVSGILMVAMGDDLEIELADILFATAIYIIGARIVIPNAIAEAFKELRQLNGSASALIGSIQMLGTAGISFIVVSLHKQSPLVVAGLFSILGMLSLVVFYLSNQNKIFAKYM